ncbi:MAG: HAMP domain-containing histidine kinase [Bryobacteraceae bacterium]|nr:HAMP domain-containing histidine kinase [Bryobacteraceae bacterium]
MKLFWGGIGLVLALLGAVAWLQSRWIDQLRDADRERRQRLLDTSLNNFRQDFQYELVRIAPALGGGPPGDPESELPLLAERLATWQSSTVYPELVQAIWILREGQIQRMDPKTYQANRAEAPQELEQLRQRLPEIPDGVLLEQLDWPAFVIPRFRPGPGPASGREGGSGFGRPPWMQPGFGPPGRGFCRPPSPGGAGMVWVVQLSKEALEKQLLPDLLRRHFGEQPEYRFRVTNARGVQLFASAGGTESASRDGQIRFLELQPVRRGPGGGPGPDGTARPGPRAAGGAWLLQATNVAGSLEAAVEVNRRRNQMIALAALLLTGSAIAMLILSARRAQKLARLQMEFVAGVSHELRTPLTVIGSAAANLADGVVAKPEQVRKYGALMRDQARSLTDQVEQILTFAGAQAGRRKLDFQPVDIAAVIDRAIEAAAPDTAGCQVEKFVADGLPTLDADVTALTQSVRNLISNAGKYAARGQWIGVRAEKRGGEVILQVEDRGPGIDPADLPRVFDPFYRGRSSDGHHGAGLGLSLVRDMIEAHGGRVEVNSDPGAGTRFTLHLPLPA